MKNRSGYTLLEVSIATAILTVVSLLSFMVIRSSAEASQVTAAKDEPRIYLVKRCSEPPSGVMTVLLRLRRRLE